MTLAKNCIRQITLKTHKTNIFGNFKIIAVGLHCCDFSKLSINIWPMRLLAILFCICDLANAIVS